MKKLLTLLLCLLPAISNAEEAITPQEVSEIRSIIIQTLAPCWAPPYNTHLQPVLINIDVTPDGRLNFAGFSEMQKYNADPNYKANADMVLKAILDPRCSTLQQIPYAEKFSQWQNLILIFEMNDPRDKIINESVNWPIGI